MQLRFLFRGLLAASVGLGLWGAVTARGQSLIHVDDNAPGDPAPGDPRFGNPDEDGSEGAPFDAIQEGIDAAVDGDEVVVAAGVYTGLENRNLNFRGKAITVRGANGPDQCIIDCEGFGRGVVFRNGETADSVLEGLTIRRGSATGDVNIGAGMLFEGTSPTIHNCVIKECVAELFQSAGAGIYCRNSNPIFIGCRIVGNSAIGFLSRGGGATLDSSDPLFIDSVIADNQSEFAAGGIQIEQTSEPEFIHTRFEGNAAIFGGAAASQSGSRPIFQSCVFRGNIATSTGGLVCNDSDPVIRDSLFVDNISMEVDHGAIDSFSNSNPLISNCTIVGNTFTGVTCTDPASTVTILNSILYDNDVDLLNCSPTYSLTTLETPGEGNIFGDPLFVGPDDYRLQETSPALDAGDPDFLPVPGEVDLDGNARVLCAEVDLGAYEKGIIGDFDCDDIVDLMDFSGWMGCVTGPLGGPFLPGCGAFDYNSDAVIDLRDFGDFANAFPG